MKPMLDPEFKDLPGAALAQLMAQYLNGLREALGSETFEELANHYVRIHPAHNEAVDAAGPTVTIDRAAGCAHVGPLGVLAGFLTYVARRGGAESFAQLVSVYGPQALDTRLPKRRMFGFMPGNPEDPQIGQRLPEGNLHQLDRPEAAWDPVYLEEMLAYQKVLAMIHASAKLGDRK